MKRCTSCGRAIDDSSGLAEHAACPWCGGTLAEDAAGPRTLSDAVQVLWSVDPDAPYDGRRAQKDLADLCPDVKGAGDDVFIAGEVGALVLLRDGKAEAARRALREDAHWDDAAVDALASAYLSLDPEAAQTDAEERDRMRREEELRREAVERIRRVEAMKREAETFRQQQEDHKDPEEAKLQAKDKIELKKAKGRKLKRRIRIVIALAVATLLFVVLSKNVALCAVSIGDGDVVYNGKAQCPEVTIQSLGNTLVEGIDYTLEYSNNTNAGEATVAIKGIGAYTGTTEKHFTIKKLQRRLKASLSASTINLGETAQINVSTKASGKIRYKSKNKSVATVDSSGKVTARATGKARIKVWVSGSSNIYRSKTLTITVIEKPSITVSPAKVKVGVGKVKKVKVTVNGTLPDEWTIWSWGDSMYCSTDWDDSWQDNNGILRITGKSVGTVTSIIKLVEGNDDKFIEDKVIATAKVKVKVR